MKGILNRLFEYQALSRSEAREVLINIAGAKYNNSQVAAFLAVYLMRSVTVEELSGFREALLELCLNSDLSEYDPVDLCGTGGDGKNTFNISTLASFVAAGAGVKVAKHGNYGVSSVSGSSNVLEHFGVKFTNEKDKLKKQIEEAGVCFLHAPLFHPAMKFVAPIRKELGVKTFFNMLGPLVNPAFPKRQIAGVFSLDLARLYNYLLQDTGVEFRILHALDGYDEVSLTGEVKVISRGGEQVLSPQSMGLARCSAADISGGASVDDAAKIFMDVLQGRATQPQRDVVAANAALAIQCVRTELSLTDAVAAAKESISSGAALGSFNRMLELSGP